MALSPVARRRLFRAGVIAGLWALYALNSTLQSHYQTQLSQRPIGWTRAFYGEYAYCGLWAVVTPIILWLRERFRIARPYIVRNAVLHFAAAVVTSATVKLTWDLVYRPMRSWYSSGVTFKSIALSIGQVYDSGLLLYSLVLLAGYVAEYYRNYRAEQVTSSTLRAQMIEAQLHALEMQIHPHFLFNTLHTISALVQEDPHAAERTIARLSDILRLTLENRQSPEVPLSREMQLLDLYLEIEQTRYEDRLTIQREIDPALLQALVPNFILQPLVENAIRYGIARSARRGVLIISATSNLEDLVLRVRNTGASLATPIHEGIGLSSTRSRLQHLYGDRQELQLRDVEPGWVEATIEIPLRFQDLGAAQPDASLLRHPEEAA